MKKQMNYFNYEERNGLFLLCFLLLLFCTFIFLQKRLLPAESNLNISIDNNKKTQGNSEASNLAEVTTFSTENKNDDLEKQSTSFLPSKKTTGLYQTENKPSVEPGVERKSDETYSISSVKDVNQSNEAHSTKRSKKRDVRRVWDEKKSQETKSSKNYRYARKPVEPFSINSKDEEDWKSIRGIGPTYAERIIKYQTWLGGFHSKEQLTEVYGITDSLYQTFEHLLIKDEPYKKIKINFTTQDELGRHPYLYWKQAQKIIRYRKHHGDFNDIQGLANIKGLDQAQINKMEPYLDFERSSKNNDLVHYSEK